jgi:hypothetical protein
MKTQELRKIIREEVRKTLSEGAILNAIKPSLEGDLKGAVQNLEKELASAGVNLNKYAGVLADCVLDIIDLAKEEQRYEIGYRED